MAGIPLYQKAAEGGGRTHETGERETDARQHLKVSPRPLRKSSGKRLLIKSSLAREIRKSLNLAKARFDEGKGHSKEDVIYKDKNITPDQAALLDGLNSHQYPPSGAIPTSSPKPLRKSRGKRLLIKCSLAQEIRAALDGGRRATAILEKALGHKYIRRWKAKNGRGWDYLYPSDLPRPFAALSALFGLKRERIEADWKKLDVEARYGLGKDAFASHVLEYLSNREKWDAYFAKEGTRGKGEKPRRAQTGGGKTKTAGAQGELFPEPAPKNEKKSSINKNLMREIWGLYSGKGAKAASAGTESAPRQGELFSEEAPSAPDSDSSWNPKSGNYRYKDTGYIAGSRKEMAELYIRRMAKEGRRVSEKDIDWEAVEENPRLAKQLIVKSNIFGKADWETLRSGGMTGGAAFLIDRVYAAVGAEPAGDDAEARRNYSIAIDGLRGRLETCASVKEVTDALKEIREELSGNFVAARKSAEVLELSEKLDNLYDRRLELERKERELARMETAKDREALAFLSREIDKIKALDKRRKKFSRYDLPPPARAEYQALVAEADAERRRLAEAHRKQHGALDEPINQGGKTVGFRRRDYLQSEIKETQAKRDALYAQKTAELIASNPLHAAWFQLGDKFHGTVNYGLFSGSKAFHAHVADARAGRHDDWKWLDKETPAVGGKGTARKAEFEMKVASAFERRGGRDVKARSTLELKKAFNLRDVQSGNWVLNDPESAKFHVDNLAAGLADLGDATGIPDGLLSMNGRLAIAIGARGKGNAGGKTAKAHYESVGRVINITKMAGGGSLAHEWFHAFDNLISEAMSGESSDRFLTEPDAGLTAKQLKPKKEAMERKARFERTGTPGAAFLYKEAAAEAEKAGVRLSPPASEGEHAREVRAAFDRLSKAIAEGNAPLRTKIAYTPSDYARAKFNFEREKGESSVVARIRDAGSLDEALDVVYSRNLKDKDKKQWAILAASWHDGKPEGNIVEANSGSHCSEFRKNAVALDGLGGKPYWATGKEMAARAFAAYVDDKLRGQGRRNDYLAYATTNDFYDDPLFGPSYPYPEGEERERINAAFDDLFAAVNGTGAIRKALGLAAPGMGATAGPWARLEQVMRRMRAAG